MRVVVLGFGIQGEKRSKIADKDLVAIVDPVRPEAQFKKIEEVPLGAYDAVLCCVPDSFKIQILTYLLKNEKHILVEKPLIASDETSLSFLKDLSDQNKVAFYTAYNHRFEPHFIRMKELIQSGKLGKIYRCRMFYGNGTARDVRNSPWRDQESGVLKDLGSHLLDTFLYWFENFDSEFHLISHRNFENKSPDHCVIAAESEMSVELEMTLLSWRNHFTCDIFAENGSAHIESLCKWGPSLFKFCKRQLPSGCPAEEHITLIQSDPTWEAEYQYFKELCKISGTNIKNDLWINETLNKLSIKINERKYA